MKLLKKLMVVFVALFMVMSLTNTVMAADDDETVTITVNRDNSYQSTASGDRAYKWYRVFTASYTANETTGDGPANADGTPFQPSATADKASYTATEAVAAELGTWVPAVENPATPAHWEAAEGNEWFELTPIVNSTNYSVKWIATYTPEGASDPVVDNRPETVQEAAAWLIENEAYEDSGNLTANEGATSWSAEVVKGYYIIDSETSGSNLIAATTNITINEKNAYPTIEKTQKDEDLDEFTDETVNVAVGDTIDYEVVVYVPGDADKNIVVADTMSSGLTKGGNFAVTVTVADTKTGTYSDLAEANYELNDLTWTIKPTADTKNKWVKFSFTATVTEDALTDADRKNSVTLTYATYTMSDEVLYTTYAGGIYKYDADTEEPLEGVEFELKEDGTAFNVTLTADGYYVPGGESNKVLTDAEGNIVIRGLDSEDEKTYTLTETEALPGYNLPAGDITITPLTEDTFDITAEEGEGESEGSDSETSGIAITPVSVPNEKGAVLPSTGGIGTTIFYVLGSALVLGAGVILVAKKRVNN